MRFRGSLLVAFTPSRMSVPPAPLLLRLQRLNLQYRWDQWSPLQRNSPSRPFGRAAMVSRPQLSPNANADNADDKENTPTLPLELPATVTTRRRRKVASPVLSSPEQQQDSQWPHLSSPQYASPAIRVLFTNEEEERRDDATDPPLEPISPRDDLGAAQSPVPAAECKDEERKESSDSGEKDKTIDEVSAEKEEEEQGSIHSDGDESDADSIIDLTSVPLRGESLSPVTALSNSTAHAATTPLPQPAVPKTPTSQFQVCDVSSSSSNSSSSSDNDDDESSRSKDGLPESPLERSVRGPSNNKETSRGGGYAVSCHSESSSQDEDSFDLDSPPPRPRQRPMPQRRPLASSSTPVVPPPPLNQEHATPRGTKQRTATAAAKSSAAGVVPQTPRQFRTTREASSEAWRAHFDAQVFGGQLAGAVELKWSNTLRSTAGLCRMMTVKRPTNGTKAATVERRAIIELAGKVVDCEDRLRETLLHEMCHAAAWVVDGVRKPPHGAHFYAWGNKATAATGLPVTRCHAYAIAFKHTWKCVGTDNSTAKDSSSSSSSSNASSISGALGLSPEVDSDGDGGELVMSGGGRGCGAVIGRHSRSVDVSKQVCGRCRGRLEYAGPAATPGSNNSEGSGGLRQKQKRAPGAFALFVQTNYAATKLALQRNKRELVTATGSPRRRAPSANSPLPKVAHADVIRALADEWAVRDEQ